jgi:hypothetical protein
LKQSLNYINLRININLFIYFYILLANFIKICLPWKNKRSLWFFWLYHLFTNELTEIVNLIHILNFSIKTFRLWWSWWKHWTQRWPLFTWQLIIFNIQFNLNIFNIFLLWCQFFVSIWNITSILSLNLETFCKIITWKTFLSFIVHFLISPHFQIFIFILIEVDESKSILLIEETNKFNPFRPPYFIY